MSRINTLYIGFINQIVGIAFNINKTYLNRDLQTCWTGAHMLIFLNDTGKSL